MIAPLSHDEARWITQGYLMALAELVRRHGIPKIARDMLADRGLGLVDMVECGLEPHDVRELRKALAGKPKPTPLEKMALSFAAEQALAQLHFGNPWGIDHRTEHSLSKRGLAEFYRTAPNERGGTIQLLKLTPIGAPIAAELAEKQRKEAGMRRVPGTALHIADGGLA